MKKFFMRTCIVLGILFIVWAFVAPSCMTFRKPDSEWVKKFADKKVALLTSTINVTGHNLHYAKTGSDSLPTLFFVHGTPGSWDAFANYMQDADLLQHYRMVSVDRPGFGYSDFGKALNLARQSEIISPLFYKLQNNKPMYLVGHSLGGPMIIKLAADNANIFKALVLISGSIDPTEEKPERWRPVIFNTPFNLIVPGAFKPSNKELWYLKNDLVLLKNDFTKINEAVYFIHGNKDTWVPPGNVAYGVSLLKNATHVDSLMIADGNHFIPWTKFAEIKQLLLNMK
jgi:pimeloyl-ACP methyl ester carboxylesterase